MVLIVPYTNGKILNPGFDKTMTCILMGIHIFQSLSQASFLTLSSLQMNFLKYHLYCGFCCLVRIQRLQTIRYVLVLPHLKLLLPKQNEQPQVHLKIKPYSQIISTISICFPIMFFQCPLKRSLKECLPVARTRIRSTFCSATIRTSRVACSLVPCITH